MESQRLQEIYRQHAAALVLYARQWCTAPDDALQEAVLALANCQPEPHDPVAWLYTVTKRRALNIARAESRRQQHHQRAAEEHSRWFSSPGMDSATETGAVMAETVVAGLESLEDEERELVVARVWGNLAFEQLAQMLGCSTSSAHRRYQAALTKLRWLMDDESRAEQANSQNCPSTSHTADNEPKSGPHRNLLSGER